MGRARRELVELAAWWSEAVLDRRGCRRGTDAAPLADWVRTTGADWSADLLAVGWGVAGGERDADDFARGVAEVSRDYGLDLFDADGEPLVASDRSFNKGRRNGGAAADFRLRPRGRCVHRSPPRTGSRSTTPALDRAVTPAVRPTVGRRGGPRRTARGGDGGARIPVHTPEEGRALFERLLAGPDRRARDRVRRPRQTSPTATARPACCWRRTARSSTPGGSEPDATRGGAVPASAWATPSRSAARCPPARCG